VFTSSRRLFRTIFTLYNALLPLLGMYIVRTGGSNSVSLSYGGSKRGEGCEIACAIFSS
jgi:hypothetical protein